MNNSYRDLDALVPTEKTVKLGGVEYKLPGDLPLEIYLRMNKAGTLENEDDQAALDELVGASVDLFAHLKKSDPAVDDLRSNVEKVLRARGVKFLFELVNNVYKEDVRTPPGEGDEQSGPPENPAMKNSGSRE